MERGRRVRVAAVRKGACFKYDLIQMDVGPAGSGGDAGFCLGFFFRDSTRDIVKTPAPLALPPSPPATFFRPRAAGFGRYDATLSKCCIRSLTRSSHAESASRYLKTRRGARGYWWHCPFLDIAIVYQAQGMERAVVIDIDITVRPTRQSSPTVPSTQQAVPCRGEGDYSHSRPTRVGWRLCTRSGRKPPPRQRPPRMNCTAGGQC